MPQQQVQPRLDARLLHDREIDGEVARAPHRAPDERARDLREAADPLGEVDVEHGQPAGLEDIDRVAPRHRRVAVVALPGAQQIARREQLGGRALAQRDAPQQQAVEHEQAEAGRDRGRPRRGAPLSGRERWRRRPAQRRSPSPAAGRPTPRRARGPPRGRVRSEHDPPPRPIRRSRRAACADRWWWNSRESRCYLPPLDSNLAWPTRVPPHQRDRRAPRPPDPRQPREPDGRGRRAPRVRRDAAAPPSRRAPRPASTRRSSSATAARPSAARACCAPSSTSTARSRRRCAAATPATRPGSTAR